MNTNRFLHVAAATLALLVIGVARAHVVLAPGGAVAGTTHAAAFKVGHACKGAHSTTALSVRLPAGFSLVRAEPRPGWTLSTKPDEVTWTASTPEAALPASAHDTFVVIGKLPARPGTLWFKVLQTCDVGASDWATLPTAEMPKPEFPAPRLDVLAADGAAVDVRDAPARAASAD